MTAVRIPPSWHIPERLATPEATFLDRRQVLKALGLGTLSLGMGAARPGALAGAEISPAELVRPALGASYAERFPAGRNLRFELGAGLDVTPEAITSRYNNFYEFTTVKDRVAEMAQGYPVEPWAVEVRGLAAKTGVLDLDELFTRFPLEERLYRFRCVERWSMQVPWTGFPLRALIDHLEPESTARWVRFTSVDDRRKLPGQRDQRWYPWPYQESLRLDEARHELAFVVLGSYGHALPMQHGAPLRLAVPWKYGFKGPKSIVRIDFSRKRPATFWNRTAPTEYGFYANVDPTKPHPRWSQRWEQDIGTGETRETRLYNGYAEVAALYDGKEI